MEVVSLLTSLNVTKTRIYDMNPQVLTAFANSGIELVVTVPNDLVASMINPSQSLQWMTTNVKPYFPVTRITGKYHIYVL
jgi:Glycosyl hydrolases family 17